MSKSFDWCISRVREGLLKEMNNFRRIFNPTPEEKAENWKRYHKLHFELAQKKGCVTCVHCRHVISYPGFVTGEECECDAGLECDTVLSSVTNCPQWEDNWKKQCEGMGHDYE